MRSALPAEKRFALVAAHPTSPLTITPVCRSYQWLRRVTAIARHHKAVAGQPPPSRPCAVASRCAWWPPHITAYFCSLLLLVQSVGTACCPAQAPQSCRLVCVAVVVIARCGNALRFYITPHCIKCMASQSPSSFGGHAPLSRPVGFTQQALCKVACAGAVASCRRSPVASHPTHRHLSPCGCACMVALVRRFAQCFQSAASPCHWGLAPAHPWARLLRKHRLRGLPVRPPRGLPQNRERALLTNRIASLPFSTLVDIGLNRDKQPPRFDIQSDCEFLDVRERNIPNATL